MSGLELEEIERAVLVGVRPLEAALQLLICKRFGAQTLSLPRPLKGGPVASKGLEPLPRRRQSALAHGCGRGGRVVLLLARAAAVSTG